MQYVHNAAAQETFKSLFGDKVWTNENPFYTFREAFGKLIEGNDNITAGFTNQMFASKVSGDFYKVWVGLVIGYKESVANKAYVLIECRYNRKTQKLTQIKASYAIGEYARTTEPLTTKRTGTAESVYQEVGTKMVEMLNTKIKAYWDGFREYYAKKTKNMCGYHLD